MPAIQDLYAPSFLCPAPASDTAPDDGTEPEACTEAKPETTYSPERHGTIAAFIRHPDFPSFRRQVERDIDALIDFATGMRETREALAAWRRKLFDVDSAGRHLSYGNTASLMYGQCADYLHRLSELVHDPRLSLQSRRSELEQLGPQLLECGEGAAEALDTSVRRLDPDRSELSGKYRHVVDRIVEQIAVETVETEYGHLLREARLDQRHHVAGLKAKLHQALGLAWPLPEDRLSHDHHAAALVARCAAQLQPLIAPGAVARVLAEDYLQRFTEAWHAHARSPQQRAFPTAGLLADCTAALQFEFGSTPPTTALLRDRADGDERECRTDATLVALHFLDEMRSTGCLGPGHRVDTLASWSDRRPSGPPSINRLLKADDLHWVETRGQQRPVDIDDLARLPAGAWRAPILESALANSEPGQLESLHALVHPGWLLSQNILDRLIGRLGMTRVEALVAQAQAEGTWDAERQSWWMQALAARDPGRPPIGLLRWSDGQVSHQLAPAHIDDLLDRRANGELSDQDLQRRLSDLLNLTFSAPPIPAPGSGVRHARRAMAAVAPLRQWWGAVGRSLRDEPPRLRPEELLDIVTKPGGDQVVPLVRCLSMDAPPGDVIHVFFEGLSALDRDGLFPTAQFMTSLGEPGLSPQGLTDRLCGLSADGLHMLLEFAMEAVLLHPSLRGDCRRLFLGDAPASAQPLSPPTLPLALVRNAVSSENTRPLNRFLSAVQRATQRGVLSPSDLSRILAGHLATPPMSSPLSPGPSGTRSLVMSILLRWAVQLAVDGHVGVAEAMRALQPAALTGAHPGPSQGELSDPERLKSAIAATCPALRFGGDGQTPTLPASELQIRRELLNRLIRRSGDGPSGLLDELRGAGRDLEAIELAKRIRSSMSGLEYEKAEIERVVGPSARRA